MLRDYYKLYKPKKYLFEGIYGGTQLITFAPELKLVTTYILVLLIFLQPFSKIWIVVSFKINQDSIAKTLCVKKEVKNNTCQGKCHLKKQLDKADEEEQKQSPTIKKERLEVLYCYYKNPFNFLKYSVTYLSKLNASYENEFYSSSFAADIFHPPKLKLI